MQKYIVFHALILMLSALFPWYCKAQSNHYTFPEAEIDHNFNFRHLTTKDGLPTNRTHRVMQDSRGFVWISSRVGLCRYDGYNIKLYHYDRMYAFNTMVEDNNGNIWISTFNGLSTLNIYTEEKRKYLNIPTDSLSVSSDIILCVYKDKKNSIWIGTWRGGLNRYYPESDNFRSFKPDPDIVSLSNNIVTIYEDKNNMLWIGTSDGVFQFDRETKMFTEIELDSSMEGFIEPLTVSMITQDSDGTMLFGTSHGFLHVDTANNKLGPSYPFFQQDAKVENIDLYVDPIKSSKTLWFIKSDFFKYDKPTATITKITSHNPSKPSDVISGGLSSIYIDESGLIWLPGNWGVNISKPGLNQFEKSQDFVESYGNATVFLRDSGKHIWIGLYGQRLLHFDERMNLLRAYGPDDFPVGKEERNINSAIHSILEDSEKNIWVGDSHNGLYLLEQGKQEFVQCLFLGYKIKKPEFIYDIYEDSQADVWIASDMGLFIHKKNTIPLNDFVNVNSGSFIDSNTILSIYEDHLGYLWVGSSLKGLFCRPPQNRLSNTFINYAPEPGNEKSLSNEHAWCIIEDVDENLWIGTEKGLNRFIREEEAFESFISETDPGATYIMDMKGDNRGYLWMVTQIGLVKLKPNIKMSSQPIRNYIKQIIPFENICPWNIDKSNDGKIFIGGKKGTEIGYYSFYPDSIIENLHIPPIFIIDFQIRNEKVNLDSSITAKSHIKLNYDENFFSFEFTALDYTNPEENQYAYYLDGFEDEWNYSGSRRTAHYTRVPPGIYNFRVKGSNNDGYWNEEGTSIMITILPPPWATWWAYVIYTLVSIGILFSMFYYYFRRQQLMHTLELEQVESEKLKELDSMKTRFFINISHEFRTPLTLILGPLEKLLSKLSDDSDKKELNIAHKHAKGLQYLINQILNISKLEAGRLQLHAAEINIIKVLRNCTQAFESLADKRNINLIFNSEKEDVKAFIDREKFEQALNNLLSNAVKFTGDGGEICVTVSILPMAARRKMAEDWKLKTGYESARIASIQISDSGQGISKEQLEYVFDRFYQVEQADSSDNQGTGIGLALTKELVELHYGVISVESEINVGSTFTILFPLGKDHLKQEEFADPISDKIPSQNYNLYPPDFIEDGTSVSENNYLKEILPILLIVEDNADMRDYIRGYFESEYNIIEAVDGQDGFEKSLKYIPDIIISDVMMPKIDGNKFCYKVKSDERTSHIPLILLTARASKESRIESLETGADDFVTKPFDIDELQVRVKNLIEQRKQLSERLEIKLQKSHSNKQIEFQDNSITSMDEQFLHKIMIILNENYSDSEFKVEDFCRRIGMSRIQLHRKIKALTRQTAGEFIRSFRLNRAAELIKHKSATLAEIAYDVGFNSPSYFTECFRKQFGKLPSKFNSED